MLQQINLFDSPKLIKEKLLVSGFSYSGKLKDLSEINIAILELAKEDFKKEIFETYSIEDIFNPEKILEIIAIYREYFNLSEDFSAERPDYFFKCFSNPINYHAKFLHRYQEKILNIHSELSLDIFDDEDFDQLQNSYLLHAFYSYYKKIRINQYPLIQVYHLYFKGSRNLEYKSSPNVRKSLSMHKHFHFLTKTDKLDRLILEKEWLESQIVDSTLQRYVIYYEVLISDITKIISELKKDD